MFLLVRIMSMYTPFILSEEETLNKRQLHHANNVKRGELIKQHVLKNGWSKLNSDYYGTDQYYYDNVTKRMYIVDPMCDEWSNNITPSFQISTDPHILALNSIPF